MSHKTRLKEYMNDRAISHGSLTPATDALMSFTCESLDYLEEHFKREITALKRKTRKEQSV